MALFSVWHTHGNQKGLITFAAQESTEQLLEHERHESSQVLMDPASQQVREFRICKRKLLELALAWAR